ncbi:MAG: cytochrome b [Pseudomonadales bacterium]|nr:cytochrome b [Pseudomonadales bacterium]
MLKNSSTHYGWISIALHWLMALMIFGMFGLGLYMVELTYYDAWYKGSLELHKSLGMLLLLLWMARIIWRVINISPAELPGPRWEQLSGQVMHMALYAVMLLLMLSGYLISTADGLAITVFELLPVPALPWSIENQEDIAGEIHEILAWLLIVMAAVHALAAIKHQLINKDGGLKRMFFSQ